MPLDIGFRLAEIHGEVRGIDAADDRNCGDLSASLQVRINTHELVTDLVNEVPFVGRLSGLYWI